MAAAGASGRAENARAAAFAAAETGSPSPAQAFRLAARPFGSTARSSRAAASRIRAGSRLGGRLGAIAPERQEVRRGPERVADGEAEVTQRGFVGVEAQDFCAKPRRSAARGGRAARLRRADRCAERRRAKRARRRRQTADRPPLPFRCARAQAGIGAGGGKACRSGVFAEVRLVLARAVAGGAERRS